MAKQRKLSRTTLEVLGAFVEDPTQERHGYELIKLAGVSSGSLYPILQRLEEDGWVEAAWEDVDPATEKRPRRRYYKVTGKGVEVYRAEMVALTRRAPGFVLGWAQ